MMLWSGICGSLGSRPASQVERSEWRRTGCIWNQIRDLESGLDDGVGIKEALSLGRGLAIHSFVDQQSNVRADIGCR
eukprot:15346109-Ditylum_brightwellii.AAC.1